MSKKRRESKKTQGKKKSSLKKKRETGSKELLGKTPKEREALVKAKQREERNDRINAGLSRAHREERTPKQRIRLLEQDNENLNRRLTFLEKHINPWTLEGSHGGSE